MTGVARILVRKGWRLILVLALLLAVPGFWLAPEAAAQEDICDQPDQHVAVPLTDLGDQPYVRMDGQQTGEIGGLYPGGSNQRPAEHEAAGLAAAAQIVPRDADGNPSPDGKVVMLSLGMSNTAREFNYFQEVAFGRRKELNPHLEIVNGALGGQTADRWLDLNALAWTEAFARLRHQKVTPQQVQVVWIKQVLTNRGDFPDKALQFEQALETIIHNLYTVYPNLKMVYLSSRTRSYLYDRGLSPEPAAYESAFAVRWLIEKQINGDPELNFDPARGEVKAPFLSWGPYFWIDGETPRSDGRIWTAEDLASDCTHPTRSGVVKVGEMLMEFFTTDSAAAIWFMAGGSRAVSPPAPQASPSLPPPTRIAASPTASPQAATALPTAEPTRVEKSTSTATSTTVPAALPSASQPPASPGRAGAGSMLWLAPVIVALVGLAVYGVMRRSGRRG